MKALSLYSGGCDGLTLAAAWAGIESVAFCECDAACRALIRQRHPEKPIYTYDTEVSADALRADGIDPEKIDIIIASPPCQCISIAGRREAAGDPRNRWPECLRILRDVRPRWFVAENPPGLLSAQKYRGDVREWPKGEFFGEIVRDLTQMGYCVGWGVWGACDVENDAQGTNGTAESSPCAPHQRERIALVAHLHGQRQFQ